MTWKTTSIWFGQDNVPLKISYKVSLLCAHGVSEGGLLPCHTPTIYVTRLGAAFPRVVPALGSTLGHLILVNPGWGCHKKTAKLRHLILLSRVTYWAPVEMLLCLWTFKLKAKKNRFAEWGCSKGPGKEIFPSVKQFLISFWFFFSPFWLTRSLHLYPPLFFFIPVSFDGLLLLLWTFLFHTLFLFLRQFAKNMQKKNINGCFFHKWKSPPIDECLFKCGRDLHLMTQAHSAWNNKDRNL